MQMCCFNRLIGPSLRPDDDDVKEEPEMREGVVSGVGREVTG